MQHIFWIVFLVAFGACIGSFLNVVIYRLPRGQSIVFPARSFCPKCGRTIRAHDNIPLVSWLVLRGRCRDCKAPISPRYLIVEAVTAAMVAGLYVAYYVVGVRADTGTLVESYPMFLAHAFLLCGLLACSLVDAEFFIIPLEVMWVCAAAGLAALAIRPPDAATWPAYVSAETVAMSIAAIVGLILAKALVHWGVLQPSFLDADDDFPSDAESGRSAAVGAPDNDAADEASPRRGDSVGVTADDGVNPRVEVLREVLFLAPAILLAIGVAQALEIWPGLSDAWRNLFDAARHPMLAPRMAAVGAGLFGLLVGGMWIWGARIFGTLAFGREAMGMGDVHLLAAVGAVAGWIVPSIVFFAAPILGLLWAVSLWLTRKQRELPYGPWLSAATLVVLIGHDRLVEKLRPIAETFQILIQRSGL